MRDRPLRYRRSSCLISFWQDERLVIENYASGSRVAASPAVIALLAALDTWRSVESLNTAATSADHRRLSRTLDRLHRLSFLHRSDRAVPREEQALAAWGMWRPEAAFFHLSTKDVPYVSPVRSEARLRSKATFERLPSPLKRLGAPRIALPLLNPSDDLTRTLLDRRTWRRFGRGRIDIGQLARLLALTWGVQQWVQIPGQGKLALKTSPSGGARHSIEAYVLATDVDGLPAGLYHYDPDGHALEKLRRARGARISAYVPHQKWYDKASVLVLMTAIFARAQWRYSYARAYRSILIESGHLGQTFCLLATSLGLAPFCTGALADSIIERDLGIDGVSESVIYACGAGTRPPGLDWAPWPYTADTPKVTPPASAKNRRRR